MLRNNRAHWKYTDRQTDRQRDRATDSTKDRQKEPKTDRQTDRPSQPVSQPASQTYRHTDIQTLTLSASVSGGQLFSRGSIDPKPHLSRVDVGRLILHGNQFGLTLNISVSVSWPVLEASVSAHRSQSGVKLGSACRLPLADSEFQDPIQIVRIRFEKWAYTNYYKLRKLNRGTNL